MQTLLIATHNPGKIKEYRLLLDDLALEVTSLSEQGIEHQAPETGDTFAANAQIKATTFAKRTGLWTWADDSGLEVDALDGRPGVLSARYGGQGLSDRDRYLRLLDELRDVRSEVRTARFRCAVCIAQPQGELFVIEDSVEGLITDQPAGDNGFGYDPVFYLPDQRMTMAQLPAETKNRISHRGKASRRAKQFLSELLELQRRARQD
jgi:XTP/dITP diphosphohydrolase